MPRVFVTKVFAYLRSSLGVLSAGRLIYRNGTRKAAITLVMAAVLGVGGLALSADLRAQVIAAGDGQSAFAIHLILALRGL